MVQETTIRVGLGQTVQIRHGGVREFICQMGKCPSEYSKEALVKGTDSVKTLEPREVGLWGRCVYVNRTGKDKLAQGRSYWLLLG